MITMRAMNDPQPGHWMVRLVKGGPEVPASIAWEQTTHEPDEPENVMDRSPILTARIAGDLCRWDEVWHRKGRPITKAEHDFQVRDHRWLRQHEPHDPKAMPRDKVDHHRMPPLF